MNESCFIETRVVVDDGRHNAFTDLLYWREAFWLVYVSAPGHFASSDSYLVLMRSLDASDWQEVHRFSGDGKDIRDPKLAIIQDRLFLFALLNASFDPQPYSTVYTVSMDGLDWEPFSEISAPGWLFGRPRTPDGQMWFVSAHWRGFDRVALFQTTNGRQWQLCADMLQMPGLDETALEFLPDGRALLAVRFESGGSLLGNQQNGTLLVTAVAPYKDWSTAIFSSETRLDGPNLFACKGRTLAVGRFQPVVGKLFRRQGSIFSRKRTALFEAGPGGLEHLVNLPSSGDTAYAGAVSLEGQLYISYYTSDPHHDWPWLYGMFLPTRVQIAVLKNIPASAGPKALAHS